MSNKNIAKIARDAFAANAIDLLQRALANGLGARITVDPHGVETHADLYDGDGVVHLTHQLHATQLALPLAPQAPAPSQPPAAVEAPADVTYPLAVGDRIILDSVAVEVLGVDRDGFVWRTTDTNPDDRDLGEMLWSDVRHAGGNTWVSRKVTTPVEADEPDEEPAPALPPKPKRTRKPRAPKAAPSTEPAALVPHRLQAVTEADELAHHGAHSLIGLRGELRGAATEALEPGLDSIQILQLLPQLAAHVRVGERIAQLHEIQGARRLTSARRLLTFRASLPFQRAQAVQVRREGVTRCVIRRGAGGCDAVDHMIWEIEGMVSTSTQAWALIRPHRHDRHLDHTAAAIHFLPTAPPSDVVPPVHVRLAATQREEVHAHDAQQASTKANNITMTTGATSTTIRIAGRIGRMPHVQLQRRGLGGGRARRQQRHARLLGVLPARVPRLGAHGGPDE